MKYVKRIANCLPNG